MTESMLLVREPLGSRRMPLPLQIGAVGAAVSVPGAAENRISIERTGTHWWLRVAAGSVVRVNGHRHSVDVALHDGDVIGLGQMQAALFIDVPEPTLELRHLQGNATVAPLEVAQLPGESVTAGAREITASGVDIGPSNATAILQRRRFSRPGALLGAAALLLVLLLGAGLLAVVPVTLTIMPASAGIAVHDLPHWQAGDRLFLWPGRHVIEISNPGYHSQQITLDASRDMVPPSPIALALLPGVLQIDTGGVVAELQVDAMPAGKLPGDISVAAGRHSLLLRAPRYLDKLIDVDVQGGGRKQRVDAALLPGWGWLELDTHPPGARVSVDGQDRGNAPQRMELDAGLRQLEIAAPGRRSWRSQIAIIAGQTLKLGVVDLSLPPSQAVRAALAEAGKSAISTAPVSAPAAPAPPAPRIASPLLGNLILLPAGSFRQGSDRREQGRRANETLRQVTLSRAFYLAETEVTNGQFRTFRAAHASGIAADRTLDLDRQPVSGVSWDEAVEFCNWLSQREGLPSAYERRDGRWQFVQPRNHGYRLPTEAEWEYAARYVDGQQWHRYAWGDALPPPGNSENLAGEESLKLPVGVAGRVDLALPGYRDEHPVAAPVGSYRRSTAGFADLGGNVSEWVHDIYASLLDVAAASDPEGATAVGPHVVRGANWRSAAVTGLRLAWRDRASAAGQMIGFRVARSVEATP